MNEYDHPRSDGFDLREHETLLKNEPARYAAVVREVSSFGIYLLDPEGVIRSWNRGAENITGFTEAEMLGRPFENLFTEDSRRDGLPQRTLQFARANRHHKDEQPRLRRDGKELIALCTLDAVRQESGALASFVEVFTDITEVKQREASLYHRATRDALTGIFNRGHFTEMAVQEIERARRFAEPLSVALLDLDHFKRVNDTYGHDAGDMALVQFSQTCQEFARKIDLVGRLGGEEFVILLPRANKEPAFEILQRLRLKVMETRITSSGGAQFGFTVSIGLASLRPHTRDLRELLRNADAALYKAKREGRNRVECWFE
ncbi:MAG: sensor domain-containing diguanylate cyclase [Stagnimonas sp.]|nr:sensor domain-containing diguanylate cyclase [Stagnimonas sp.]